MSVSNEKMISNLLRFNWSRDAAKLNVSDNNHLLFTCLTHINYDDDKNYL